MIIDEPQPVTQAVLQAMAQGDAPRLREVMSALVQQMHDSVREVRLTEAEWVRGVEFLNRSGQATHNQHDESILFSGAIGVSSLVCLLNNDAPERAAALLARARAPSVRVLAIAPGVAATEFVPGRSKMFIPCAAVLDRDGRPLRGPALAGDAAVCTGGVLTLKSAFTAVGIVFPWWRFPTLRAGTCGSVRRVATGKPAK